VSRSASIVSPKTARSFEATSSSTAFVRTVEQYAH